MKPPTILLVDLTNDNPAVWTSSYGVRKTLFGIDKTGEDDELAESRTLRDAWTNNWSSDHTKGSKNIFSPHYGA